MSNAVPTNPILGLSSKSFTAEVVGDPSPILIDFWAPWCGPCRMMKPVLADVAASLAGEVRVAELNVDLEPAIADAFGIQGIPTLVLIKEGKVIDSVSGFVPAGRLVSQVRAKLGVNNG